MNSAAHRASTSAEARRLGHALAAASDEALSRAVAVFDSLPQRREADRLLDAARPRLRRLRPPRPITLPRLLFLPLDGVIDDAKDWKRAPGRLPRSALLPIAAAVRSAIGPRADAIEAEFAGATFSDYNTITHAGGRLWQAAAEASNGLKPPAEWTGTGFTAADFRNAVTLSAGVWWHAGPLWAALAAAHDGPPEALVRTAMESAATEDAMVRQAMAATMLLKAACPGTVATVVGSALPGSAAETLLDHWMEASKPDFTQHDAKGACRLAEDFVRAIENVEASGAIQQPERRQRLQALRSAVSEACHETYTATFVSSVIEPLRTQGTQISDAEITTMEDSARSLRRLEVAGRSLGGSARYDVTLRRMTEILTNLRNSAAARPADVARLTEIVAGPEAALKLLDAG